jgi:lysozyme family protein
VRENLNYIIEVTTQLEGGYVNNPNDKGGPTNHGVTIGTLSGYLGRRATIAEVRALSKPAAIEILRKGYYDKVWGDQLPSGLDLSMTDFAVNSGPSRAVKEIQKLVGVHEDGIMGNITLAAIKAQDTRALNDAYNAARMSFLKGLSGKTGFPTFGRGWTIRVTGKDPKKQYKDAPGIVGMSRALIEKGPKVVMIPPSVVTDAGKASDASRGVTATKTGKAITIASVGAVLSTALEWAPKIIEFAQGAPGLAEKLSPIAIFVPQLGAVIQVLTVLGTIGAMFANRTKERAAGFDYQTN